MKDWFQPLLFASLVSTTIGCCCTSGDISTDDGEVLLEGEVRNMVSAPENVAPEPSLSDDPEANLRWFAQRYSEQLGKLESSPYTDPDNNREEQTVYKPLSHKVELMNSDSADEPHQAVVTLNIKSMERYDGADHESFTTDYRLRLIARQGRWEIDKAEMRDPNFENWSEVSEFFGWEKPIFDAAKIVYGLEVDPF